MAPLEHSQLGAVPVVSLCHSGRGLETQQLLRADTTWIHR